MINHCEICKREIELLHKHHVVPKSEGGTKGEIIKCCEMCGSMIHMLFTEKELANMNLEELKNTEQIKNFLKWIKAKPPHYKVGMKMSNRVKQRRRR